MSCLLAAPGDGFENAMNEKVADRPHELDLGFRLLLSHCPLIHPPRVDALAKAELAPTAGQKGVEVDLMPPHRRIADLHDWVARVLRLRPRLDHAASLSGNG